MKDTDYAMQGQLDTHSGQIQELQDTLVNDFETIENEESQIEDTIASTEKGLESEIKESTTSLQGEIDS